MFISSLTYDDDCYIRAASYKTAVSGLQQDGHQQDTIGSSIKI